MLFIKIPYHNLEFSLIKLSRSKKNAEWARFGDPLVNFWTLIKHKNEAYIRKIENDER